LSAEANKADRDFQRAQKKKEGIGGSPFLPILSISRIKLCFDYISFGPFVKDFPVEKSKIALF
jgi:hypothetical protein